VAGSVVGLALACPDSWEEYFKGIRGEEINIILLAALH
jgi:hypothetical protein